MKLLNYLELLPWSECCSKSHGANSFFGSCQLQINVFSLCRRGSKLRLTIAVLLALVTRKWDLPTDTPVAMSQTGKLSLLCYSSTRSVHIYRFNIKVSLTNAHSKMSQNTVKVFVLVCDDVKKQQGQDLG